MLISLRAWGAWKPEQPIHLPPGALQDPGCLGPLLPLGKATTPGHGGQSSRWTGQTSWGPLPAQRSQPSPARVPPSPCAPSDPQRLCSAGSEGSSAPGHQEPRRQPHHASVSCPGPRLWHSGSPGALGPHPHEAFEAGVSTGLSETPPCPCSGPLSGPCWPLNQQSVLGLPNGGKPRSPALAEQGQQAHALPNHCLASAGARWGRRGPGMSQGKLRCSGVEPVGPEDGTGAEWSDSRCPCPRLAPSPQPSVPRG